MQRFINDIKKYSGYTIYSAKSELKSEVASSYLNWLWWILDPLFFMLVYTFISVIVFKATEPYFPIFVFIGLTVWNFFNRCVISSVKIVQNNSAIVSKVYIPKFILILQKMYVNGFKLLISFALVFIMMVIYRVPLTGKIVYMIPVLATLFVITFGCCSIVLHLGVFVEDLSNVLTIVLRLVFYMSGIFYSIGSRVPEPYNMILLKGNPTAYLIDELRRTMLYNQMPYRKWLILWFAAGVILSAIGVRYIYRHENSYVKVI